MAVHDNTYDTLDAELHEKYVLLLQAAKSLRNSRHAYFVSLFARNIPFASLARWTLFGTPQF